MSIVKLYHRNGLLTLFYHLLICGYILPIFYLSSIYKFLFIPLKSVSVPLLTFHFFFLKDANLKVGLGPQWE